MDEQPSVDDLKEARDGRLYAGPRGPSCFYCAGKIEYHERIIRMHVDGRDPETGERFGRMAYAHKKCMDKRGDK